MSIGSSLISTCAEPGSQDLESGTPPRQPPHPITQSTPVPSSLNKRGEVSSESESHIFNDTYVLHRMEQVTENNIDLIISDHPCYKTCICGDCIAPPDVIKFFNLLPSLKYFTVDEEYKRIEYPKETLPPP